jgi:hypothetical protein
MMKSIIFLVLTLTSLVSGGPLFCSSSNATTGNTTLVAEGDSPAYFRVEPGISNALCSGVYATKIRVQYGSDQFSLAPGCLNFLDLIGGMKANTDVDMVIICQGAEPKGTGDDDNKIKVVFVSRNNSIGNPEISGTQWVEVRLQAISLEQNKVASTPAFLGVKLNDEGTFTITTLYC